jgi:hypothetical protein
MKAFYALVIVLFSFAAPAQTLETSIAAYDLDCLGETTRQSTTPARMIAIELLCAAMFDEADVAIVRPNPPNNDKLTADDTIEQDAMPPQIVATQPTIEKLDAANINEADGVAITDPNDVEEVPAGAIQPSNENSAANDKPSVDDTIEQGTMPAQVVATQPTIEQLGETMLNDADDVAITGRNDAEEVPLGAIQRSNENSTLNDKPSVDEGVADADIELMLRKNPAKLGLDG